MVGSRRGEYIRVLLLKGNILLREDRPAELASHRLRVAVSRRVPHDAIVEVAGKEDGLAGCDSRGHARTCDG